MDESPQTLKHWVTFAGVVLVIVVLYWAQAVFVPLALAALLSFVLSPLVSWVERWAGRVPAVLMVVTLVFVALGLAGWGLARQMDGLAGDLPRFRAPGTSERPTAQTAGPSSPSRGWPPFADSHRTSPRRS